MRTFLLSLAIGCSLAGAAMADAANKASASCGQGQTCGNEHRCGRCGRHCACERYCQVVCETKEIKKTVWAVKCAEFCAALPRLCHDCCCESAETGVSAAPCPHGKCKHCDVCAAEERKNYVPPKCGKVRDAKSLVKKEVVCKVPCYKCVVVYCCPQCIGPQPSIEQAPPPPAKAPQQPLPPPPLPSKTARSVAPESTLLVN